MEYNINTLSIAYIEDLAKRNINRHSVMPTFNIETYNDLTYLQCMEDITNDFNHFDDLFVTEKFLKGD